MKRSYHVHSALCWYVSIILTPMALVCIGECVIQVNDGYFTWGNNLSTLTDINIQIPTGTQCLLLIFFSQTINDFVFSYFLK